MPLAPGSVFSRKALGPALKYGVALQPPAPHGAGSLCLSPQMGTGSEGSHGKENLGGVGDALATKFLSLCWS